MQFDTQTSSNSNQIVISLPANDQVNDCYDHNAIAETIDFDNQAYLLSQLADLLQPVSNS